MAKAQGHECLISLHHEFCTNNSKCNFKCKRFLYSATSLICYFCNLKFEKNREMRSVALTVLNLNATLLMSVALRLLCTVNATLLTNSLENT